MTLLRESCHEAEDPQPNNTRKQKRRKNKRTAARLKIATLNMKGRGSLPPDQHNDKWSKINQIMRDKKIAVLAVQETHLQQIHVDTLHSLFGKRIQILHSAPEERASTSRGIAFVLNKERLDTSKISLTEIIPGRAALLSCKWHNEVPLHILNIYAPNDRADNEHFWNEISNKWDSEQLPIPTAMTGDFNIVEEAKDRLPERADHSGAVHALQDLCIKFRLIDTWRETYPTEREYTYLQDHGLSMSRLDRIYLNNKTGKNATDWIVEPADALSTDHLLLSVSIADDKLPFVGGGRWSIPKVVLADHEFLDRISNQGRTFIELTNLRKSLREPDNIQERYKAFKDDIMVTARRLAKINIPKIVKRISKLKEERKQILNSPKPRDELYVATQASALMDRIRTLEARRFNSTRKSVATKDWTHGEQITKYWVRTS
ncbi:DNase I-like protein, partial [Trametopsis cervina]